MFILNDGTVLGSGIAQEDVEYGEVVVDADDGGVRRADATDRVDGFAAATMTSERIDEHRFDDNNPEDTYEAVENDRVPYGANDQGDHPRGLTIPNGPAPQIDHGTVVGVIDSSSVDAPNGAAGRLVEEGYTADINGDGTTTTFNRSNGNFKAVGLAYRSEATQNGDYVQIVRRLDL